MHQKCQYSDKISEKTQVNIKLRIKVVVHHKIKIYSLQNVVVHFGNMKEFRKIIQNYV